MKKTLLAAALVTGFAGVAHAESSVTLYGLVDAGYGYQSTQSKYSGDLLAGQTGKVTKRGYGFQGGGVMNGNRWGLKGTEDLGNGTSAIFVLESGFNVGDGEHSQDEKLFGRQAYVGLTGDSWGTFTLGRQYNAGDAFVAPIDPFGTGGGYASAVRIFGDSLSTRYDNAIKYVSPNFSGFQFGLGLVHSDRSTKYTGDQALIAGYAGNTTVKNREFGVTTGLGYTSGPIYVGASFDYLDSKTTTTGLPTARGKVKAWNIGGTYDFEVVKLHLMYGGQADGAIGGLNLAGSVLGSLDGVPGAMVDKGLRQHSWLAGLSAPVGDAGKVMFSYAGNNIKNNRTRDAMGLDKLKISSHNFALGYRHSLSKRTSVYGVASYGWSNLKGRVADVNGKVKTTQSQAIIGLQHRF